MKKSTLQNDEPAKLPPICQHTLYILKFKTDPRGTDFVEETGGGINFA